MKPQRIQFPKSFFFLLFSSVLMFVAGCAKYLPESGLTGAIETGKEVQVLNATIPAGGATLTVTESGSPLKGLELVVKPGSFAEDQKVEIASSEILANDFGEFFHPVGPMISITTEELYATMPMDLKIPLTLPEGHFAVAYLYNPDDGELEALPTISEETGFITVSSRHFSTGAKTLKSGGESDPDHDYRIVVASASKEAVTGNHEILSGFEVGVDDWEFVNYGSYLTQAGQCAGQSATAIWYFARYKKELGSLFHRYDTNISETRPDEKWMDNPLGYRFAAVIQSEMDFTPWEALMKKQMENPELFWRNLAQAMLINKRPQLVFVKNSSKTTGHAIICYKMDLANKKVFVADPNYPGNPNKFFGYTDHWIGPYISQYMAGMGDVSFDQIGLVQISQYVPIREIRQRWTEFEAKTIGEYLFPEYQLHLDNAAGPELKDGMTVTKSEFKVVNRSDQCSGFIAGTDRLQPLYIFSKTGETLYSYNIAHQGVGSCSLEPGENTIGIQVNGYNTALKECYVDFQWFKLNCSKIELSIDPSLIYTVAGKSCTLTATLKGTAPSDYKTVWTFGDETPQVTVDNSLTAEHTYNKDGGFPVVCSLYDKSNNTLLTSATAMVWVVPTLFSDLISTKTLFVRFEAFMLGDNGDLVQPLEITDEYKNHLKQRIKWNGAAFTLTFRYPLPGNGADSLIVTGTLDGLASSDGKMIETLTATQRKEFKSKTGYWRTDAITLKNVPLTSNDNIGVKYQVSGPTVEGYVSEIKISWNKENLSTGEYQVVNLKSIDYTLSPWPQLRVDFYK